MRKIIVFIGFLLFGIEVLAQGEVYVLTADLDLNIENLNGPVRYLTVPAGTYCAAANRLNFTFEQVVEPQDATMWCWAACISMVLHYQGVQTTQYEIVNRAFGELINQGANCNEIANTVNGWNANGVEMKAWCEGALSSNNIVKSLADHYPLIVGMDIPNQDINHAYVLTAIFYRRDSNGDKIPIAVSLRDPWPTNKSLTHLTWSEFRNRQVCAVHVEPIK